MHSTSIEHDMLRLAIRYMILAVFAMMSTNLTSMYGFLRAEIPSIRDDPHVLNTHLVINMFDCLVNLICLYLQFSFGKSSYQKYCHFIDICFQSCFIKLLRLNVRNKPNKNNKNTSSNNADSNKTTIQIDMSISPPTTN